MSKKARPRVGVGPPDAGSVPLNGVSCAACETVFDREEILPRLCQWSYVSEDGERPGHYHRTLQVGLLCAQCEQAMDTMSDFTAPEPVPGFAPPELGEP